MKKVNKALMATVAILLSLVLISTSVLSGVFAKFVDTKSAGATVSLKAFGLTLSVNKGSSASSVTFSPEGSNSTTALSATVSYTIDPSSKDAQKFLVFTLSGDPNVDKVKLVLTIEVDGVSNFYFEGTEDGKIPAGNHIPIEFLTKIDPDGNRTTADRNWFNPTNNEDLETLLINGMVADVNANTNSTLYSSYNKDDPERPYDIKAIPIPNSSYVDTFEMVIWDTSVPSNKLQVDESITFAARRYREQDTQVDGLTSTEANLLLTHLAERDPSLTITYTVSLEQVVD